MDTCEIEVNNKKIRYLITVDHYSDFYEIDELRDLSGKNTIEICKRNFARHGIPDTVITDNATQFINEDFAKFTKEWNFKHITSSPHYPKGNGKAEATVKIAKNLIQKTSLEGEDIWLALLIARNTPNTIGTSPVQRLFSRRTKTTIPTKIENLKPKIIDNVTEKIELRRRTSKLYYDRSARKLPKLDIGQEVIVRLKPELNNDWSQGIILEELADRSFLVKVGEKTYRRNEHHIKPTSNIQTTESRPTNDEVMMEKHRSPKRVTFKDEIVRNSSEEDEVSRNNKTIPEKKLVRTNPEENINTETSENSPIRRSERIRRPPARFRDFC